MSYQIVLPAVMVLGFIIALFGVINFGYHQYHDPLALHRPGGKDGLRELYSETELQHSAYHGPRWFLYAIICVIGISMMLIGLVLYLGFSFVDWLSHRFG